MTSLLWGEDMEFRIKEARKLAKMSQSDLAAKLGVARNTLSGYETGQHDPKSDILNLIAKECGVTVDFLLGREEEKPSAVTSEELLDMELIERLTSLTEEELARVDAFVQGLLAAR